MTESSLSSSLCLSNEFSYESLIKCDLKDIEVKDIYDDFQFVIEIMTLDIFLILRTMQIFFQILAQKWSYVYEENSPAALTFLLQMFIDCTGKSFLLDHYLIMTGNFQEVLYNKKESVSILAVF